MTSLVLASTSIFRKALLEKFNVPFDCAKPDIDESAKADETPQALVERLAIEKAQAVANDFSQHLIIGSDQVAVCHGEILGKPHTLENAIKQLTKFSNNKVIFYTGLCVYNSKTKQTSSIVEPFEVHFKSLTEQEIIQYLNAEQPFNCAGSFKSEGLGICLFEKLVGDDPNSLIGLPLIKLHQLLKQHDYDVLARQQVKPMS